MVFTIAMAVLISAITSALVAFLVTTSMIKKHRGSP